MSTTSNPFANRDDFVAVYRSEAEGLLRYFFGKTADPDIAAELVAETFAVALESAKRYDPDAGLPAQWIYGIGKNLLALYWRREKVAKKARRRLQIPAEMIDVETAEMLFRTETVIDGQLAMDALGNLPAKLRDAVRLRVVGQLSYRDIGDAIGCTEQAARVRVFRGLKQLRSVL